MKKAFSLVELLVVIALSGVMATLFYNYANFGFYQQSALTTTLQTHLSSITQAALHCKNISDSLPTQMDGSEANDTPVYELECQSDPPYLLDGYDSFFMPKAPSGFDDFSATQNGDALYIQTAATIGSDLEEVLEKLHESYSLHQYETFEQSGKLLARYYIAR